MTGRQRFTAERMTPEPVEYAVAVDRYLAAAGLGEQSRRIYRIALTTWAWPLVGRAAPVGGERRRAGPPVLPLALLDQPAVGARLRAAVRQRAEAAPASTFNRELSTLRGALAWWRGQGWLSADPLAEVGSRPAPVAATRLSAREVTAVLALRAPLRDQTLWHLLHDTGAAIERALALDVADLDLVRHRTRQRLATQLTWQPGTGQLLSFLLVSRTQGPVFLTDRRAPAGTPAADRCPLTGRGRLSYRRAAELFTAATRPLDPEHRGWTLRQLRRSEGGRGTG